MRKMFGIPVVLSMLVIPASVVPTMAGTSVQFSIEARSGYSTFNDLEEDMDWDNMIVVNNDRIGFWVTLSSGQRVFRCRDMWYDNSCDDWRYGPWWNDYTHGPFNGILFHVFMNQYYPRYHERYFFHNNGYFFRYDHRYNNNHSDYRYGYSDYRAPRVERNEYAIHREKENVQQIAPVRERESSRTAITQPVRTDGGNRIDRTSSDRSAGSRTQIVHERGTTRVQPSSNGTRVTRTETRREIQRW